VSSTFLVSFSCFSVFLCKSAKCPLSSISSSKLVCEPNLTFTYLFFSFFSCVLFFSLFFQGNKSFVAFSNLNDAESLTQTWKVVFHFLPVSHPLISPQVCTKVASFLEQGQRLENLSWRLWHLQNLIVDTDNAKSRREFRKLSKCMGDKLDKEKGRYVFRSFSFPTRP
jgi:hypothetical protein